MTAQTIHMPILTTSDVAFNPSNMRSTSPNLRSTSPFNSKPVGTRYEAVPHQGPGTATYVPQPSRAQLKANNGILASPKRPFWVRDPEGKDFIDIDGNIVSPRWILYDPKGGEPAGKGCTCM